MQGQHAEERASTTPIQALPPASALDLDVLDALPLHLKRELERAYGEDCGSSLHHHGLCATVLIYRLSEELSSLCCQDCVGRSDRILRKECCMACRVYSSTQAC